eukprot:7547934-Lingulodinium_polyedra.AAC.1
MRPRLGRTTTRSRRQLSRRFRPPGQRTRSSLFLVVHERLPWQIVVALGHEPALSLALQH